MRNALAKPAISLAIGAVLALALVVVMGHGGASPVDAADCRSFTATPTASPTPTPTAPWVPSFSQLICNDTTADANDLHFIVTREVDNADPVSAVIAGCPSPSYTYWGASPPDYVNVAVVWATPCVAPGEYVFVDMVANCVTPQPGCNVPKISCYHWTLDGAALPSASPAVNPPLCAAAIVTPTPVGIGGAVDLVTSATDDSGANLALWGLVAVMLALAASGVLAYHRAKR
jgi:hypothetical protein